MRYRTKLICAACIMPLAALIFSLSWGRYPLSFIKILSILFRTDAFAAVTTADYNIFMTIRLPRTLFVFPSAAAIGLTAVSLQSLFR